MYGACILIIEKRIATHFLQITRMQHGFGVF